MNILFLYCVYITLDLTVFVVQYLILHNYLAVIYTYVYI